MGRIQKFLLVVGLFPLLLTSCYKDFKKVRVKPFRPDLVLPVAEADSVTVMDMLFENTYVKDLVKTDPLGLVVFEYGVQVPLNSNLPLKKPKVEELVFKNGKVLGLLNRKDDEIITLTMSKGTFLIADKDVTLELENGEKLDLKKGDSTEIKDKDVELKCVQDNTINCTIAIKGNGVKKVKVRPGALQDMDYKTGEASIGASGDLLWYRGELAQGQLVVDVVKREGWCKDYDIKYWFENFRLVRKNYKDGREEEVEIEGKLDGLPLNKKGGGDFTAVMKAGELGSKEYEIGNWLQLSSSWMTKIKSGSFHYKLADDAKEVNLKLEENHLLNMNLKLKFPLSGKFDALVRQFPKDAGGTTGKGVDLPDVNELLAGASPRVRARFTDEDTVKLHFYFTNTTPFDIYFAVKVGEFDPFPSGVAASSIAVKSDGIGSAQLRGNTTLTIDKFKFVKAVGSPELGAEGTSKEGSICEHEVTIGIPFKEYESARKGAQAQKVLGLLLFRTPEGKVSSPRLTDYIKVRMGVELAPEVEIELTNNKEK